MRYFFESAMVEKEGEFRFHIPFNIWEVVKQRGEIPGEMILDNKMINCMLMPMEKGKYEIQITREDAEGIEPNVIHKILLHIYGTLIKIDQNSPYSVENPIRTIDHVDVIMQPEDGLCGQACVAMLAGVTIAEVITVMDCQEWQATMGRMISALNYYGIDHSQVIMYTEGKPNVVLPKCCIMMEKMGRYCHYLIHYDNRFYDSNLGIMEEYDTTKLLGYLEIIC